MSTDLLLNQAKEEINNLLAVTLVANMPMNVPHRQKWLKVNMRGSRQQNQVEWTQQRQRSKALHLEHAANESISLSNGHFSSRKVAEGDDSGLIYPRMGAMQMSFQIRGRW